MPIHELLSLYGYGGGSPVDEEEEEEEEVEDDEDDGEAEDDEEEEEEDLDNDESSRSTGEMKRNKVRRHGTRSRVSFPLQSTPTNRLKACGAHSDKVHM